MSHTIQHQKKHENFSQWAGGTYPPPRYASVYVYKITNDRCDVLCRVEPNYSVSTPPFYRKYRYTEKEDLCIKLCVIWVQFCENTAIPQFISIPHNIILFKV